MALKVSKLTKREFTYIPIEEREEKNPVKFIIRLLPKMVRAKLEDSLLKINQDGTFAFANATYVLEMFKRGVVDIQGLVDEDGKEIKVEKTPDGHLTDEFIEMLPDELIQEVGNVIISIAKDPKNANFYLGEKGE